MHDVFYFTDIHGARPLFDAIMNYCREQDDEATIIFGGDAIDRGKDGYAIMKELLDNPKVVYLKGNHEDMFVKAAYEIKEHFDFSNRTDDKITDILYSCRYYDYKYQGIKNSIGNGGLPTLMAWIHDGMPMDIVDRVAHLSYTFSYGNADFCHAAGVYETFVGAANAEYNNEKVDEYAATSLIWTRTGLPLGWAPNRIAIFGHTPTVYLSEFADEYVDDIEEEDSVPIKYNGNDLDDRYTGEKLDMDTGAVFTGRAFVLNVLTMKAQGFELENEKVKKIECIQF